MVNVTGSCTVGMGVTGVLAVVSDLGCVSREIVE